MLKTKKKQKNLFLIVKLVLFGGVLYLLYSQISGFEDKAWKTFELKRPISFVLAVLLVIPNIWLAFVKWRVTLNTLGLQTTKSNRIQSFFAGLITGVMTPNMLGNFIGRFYYFDKQHRGMITALTMFGNFAQFLASITFGTAAVVILGEMLVLDDNRSILIWLCTGVVLSYLIYFFIDNFLHRIRSINFTSELKATLKAHPNFRIYILFLSLGRFAIFTTQFSLMLNAFGAEFTWTLIAAIWQVYLITIIAPSLFLGKIGVKESISLFVLSGMGLNDFSILFSSVLIWFINTMSPALLGFVICRKKDE